MATPNPYQSSVLAEPVSTLPRSRIGLAALLCGGVAWLSVLLWVLSWFGLLAERLRVDGSWLGLLSVCLAFIGTLLGLMTCFQIGVNKRQGVVGLGLSSLLLLALLGWVWWLGEAV
ncbi:hypothetical protein LVJ82_07825 [Vitreoscilla massiliensis]|uniref:Uncharacterized protein n=1 Tax=Vitreoscilla massiliensis TaxID=1689272 RepID=A0ABY4E8R5_9NEIS|nr:hypothetical protein [Vitreoscilla massiliensis]UOO90858.1 hypothetical protein LVJ82_07825 [Vitreoscilla massiliensis]